jgi:hypothetical protein
VIGLTDVVMAETTVVVSDIYDLTCYRLNFGKVFCDCNFIVKANVEMKTMKKKA